MLCLTHEDSYDEMMGWDFEEVAIDRLVCSDFSATREQIVERVMEYVTKVVDKDTQLTRAI